MDASILLAVTIFVRMTEGFLSPALGCPSVRNKIKGTLLLNFSRLIALNNASFMLVLPFACTRLSTKPLASNMLVGEAKAASDFH